MSAVASRIHRHVADAPLPLLGVEGLSVSSEDGRALVSNVTFSLHAGSTLGIVGESGSGKSLTCRALLGLLPASLHVGGGALRFDGLDLRSLNDREYRSLRRTRFGAVFQDPGSYLNPSSRIGAQLVEALRERGGLSTSGAKAAALGLLDDVGIADPKAVVRQFPHELSGGMLQRILIAIALTGSPDLLIADEVTTALDVVVQRQVLDLLLRYKQQRGLAMVFVSHDLALVSQVCDYLIVMKDGEVVEQGEREKVISWPAHPYTQLLIADHLKFGLPPHV